MEHRPRTSTPSHDDRAAGTEAGARRRRIGVATFDELLAAARRLGDRPLVTVTGREFTVRVFRDRELVFTPASTGIGRSDGRKAQEAFPAAWFATGSLRPGDYMHVSRNSSYLIGLLVALGASG